MKSLIGAFKNVKRLGCKKTLAWLSNDYKFGQTEFQLNGRGGFDEDGAVRLGRFEQIKLKLDFR